MPSKTLLMSAKVANYCKNASQYGIKASYEIDFKAVMDWVWMIRSSIAKNDSVERMV